MSIFKKVQDDVARIVDRLVAEQVIVLNGPLPVFVVEPPRDPSHGDMATNVAMTLTKLAEKPPRVLAELIKARIEALAYVDSVEIAGPGFINMRLNPSAWHDEVRTILREAAHYGDSDLGQKQKVNVEFVSANPTGPMHAGHVRGAVLGDTLCRLLAKAGYDVTREYYMNDAGTQIDVLTDTTYLRYREALGEDIGPIPEGLYPGEYLKDLAQALVKRDSDKWQGKSRDVWKEPLREFATGYIIEMIKEDLNLIGIKHDFFSNERVLIENGTLDKVFKLLEEKGLIYRGTLPPPKGKVMENWEPVELILFRSSQFGDDVDRPLKKRDGTWAYVMPDLAYHYDKVQRGFMYMINVLGTDHGGYLERLRPGVAAFSGGKARLEVIFNNIVKISKNGVPVKLSKRSGNLITLREMVEQVGAGAVRFFMLTRAPESELEFDFVKVIEQSKDNPVFYVQYAHARCCSVMRNVAQLIPGLDTSLEALLKIDLSKITAPEEIQLIRALANWPRVVEAAATAQEPHRIAFFLMDLAAHFHSFWNKGNDNASLRFILPNDPELTKVKLVLVKAVQTVLAGGLAVMGCPALEEMRHDQSIAT
ncbi:MAG: arginine--tRNA ligase [Proteobacteria bacterium]|jgi:arginyl-tRNA synthetase|nr:arginine--tRNA ligase [Alphaproteobacteria bacterium]NCC02704.1 arginine--tRNA ligase [Pseudomonadota bacterium]